MDKRKTYKDKNIWVGTLIGGPLAAGYLISENFITFEEPEKVKPTWIITIIVTILAVLVPQFINFPTGLIPIVISALAFGLFKKYQEDKQINYVKSGGSVHSWGRVLAVSILGFAITFIALFLYSFATI